MCSRLLHNWAMSIFAGEANHIFQIPLRKPLHLRQVIREVTREPGNDARAPAFFFLHGGNGAADVPVEMDEFRIGRERGLDLRGADAAFHRAEKRRIAGKSGLAGRR